MKIPSEEVKWSQEFESFKALNSINKPINSSSYSCSTKNDDKSNLIVKFWVTDKPLPIKQLKVYYLKDYSQIKRLEAMVVRHNFIFTSTKELKIIFSVLGSNPITEEYKITGNQKFFWEEAQYFSLMGNIVVK